MALSLMMATDYALRAMLYIASMPEGTVVLRSQVADSQAIPPSFTAKVLRRLVRAKLLASSRGVNGGFSLARQPVEITVLDIVEAVEGPLSMTQCALHADDCGWSCDCPASLVWPRVQDSLRATLGGFTLETLLSAPRRNGRVASLVQLESTREPLVAVG